MSTKGDVSCHYGKIGYALEVIYIDKLELSLENLFLGKQKIRIVK